MTQGETYQHVIERVKRAAHARGFCVHNGRRIGALRLWDGMAERYVKSGYPDEILAWLA